MSGSASITTSALTVGQHNITATFTDTSGNFNGSSSGILTHTVSQAGTTTSITSDSPDLLPDADWAYYEKMRDYLESGAFSLSASGPIVPETDATTYNGSRWKLAQSTYSTREAALAEYMRVAVRPEFSWSWKSAQFQYDIFKRTTDKRNDAYRAGFTDLMVIGANHILSMVDAFTTIRLRAVTNARGETFIGARVAW